APAAEDAAALERLVEPLVGVERHRVRELDPGQRRAAALGYRREAAVRRIHVEPDTAVTADVRDLAKRIDRARARRAGRGRDEERLTPRARVRLHRGDERVG